MDTFSITNLAELEDFAPKFGFGDFQEARFATKPLGANQLGLGYLRVKPDQRMPFAHRHEDQEEIYVVLAGSGTAVLNDVEHQIRALDAIRVSANVARWFTAGPDGLDLLAFGAPALSGDTNDAVMLGDTGEPVTQ